jgi:hypothetical protein
MSGNETDSQIPQSELQTKMKESFSRFEELRGFL